MTWGTDSWGINSWSAETTAVISISISPSRIDLIFSKTAPILGILFFPDSDITDGSWTDKDGGTNLFASVDEEVIDDVDYIKSRLNPSNDICEINLSNPSSTPGQPFEIFYRYKNSGEVKLDLIVKLIQGTTVVATWTHLNIGQSFVTANQTLTSLEFASISDFNDLRIRFQANIG